MLHIWGHSSIVTAGFQLFLFVFHPQAACSMANMALLGLKGETRNSSRSDTFQI